MDNREIVGFEELTAVEQDIVKNAKGWNGSEYHDQGIVIKLADGDTAGYIVLEKGEQVEAPVETANEEVAPEANPESAAESYARGEGEVAPEETVPGTGAESEESVNAQTSETDAETGEVAPTE